MTIRARGTGDGTDRTTRPPDVGARGDGRAGAGDAAGLDGRQHCEHRLARAGRRLRCSLSAGSMGDNRLSAGGDDACGERGRTGRQAGPCESPAGGPCAVHRGLRAVCRGPCPAGADRGAGGSGDGRGNPYGADGGAGARRGARGADRPCDGPAGDDVGDRHGTWPVAGRGADRRFRLAGRVLGAGADRGGELCAGIPVSAAHGAARGGDGKTVRRGRNGRAGGDAGGLYPGGHGGGRMERRPVGCRAAGTGNVRADAVARRTPPGPASHVARGGAGHEVLRSACWSPR